MAAAAEAVATEAAAEAAEDAETTSDTHTRDKWGWVWVALRIPTPKAAQTNQLVAPLQIWRRQLQHRCPALLTLLEPLSDVEFKPFNQIRRDASCVVNTHALDPDHCVDVSKIRAGALLRTVSAKVPHQWYQAIAGIPSAVQAVKEKLVSLHTWRAASLFVKFVDQWCVTPSHRQELGLQLNVRFRPSEQVMSLHWAHVHVSASLPYRLEDANDTHADDAHAWWCEPYKEDVLERATLMTTSQPSAHALVALGLMAHVHWRLDVEAEEEEVAAATEVAAAADVNAADKSDMHDSGVTETDTNSA